MKRVVAADRGRDKACTHPERTDVRGGGRVQRAAQDKVGAEAVCRFMWGDWKV